MSISSRTPTETKATKTDTSAEAGADTSAAGARGRLLAAAEALIYAGGIHATGVDAIVKLSGTARKSFYTHFESKDALVAAALEQRDERWMRWFIEGTLKRADAPRERLLAMFDVLHEWFRSKDFHGCAFLNAAGEIASPHDPIRVVARQHKERLLAFVRETCDALFATQDESGEPKAHEAAATALSRQWLILIDGAIGVALVSGNPDAANDAKNAARPLLDAALQQDFKAPPKRRTSTSTRRRQDQS
ncbi:TetR/AcrR family transcriptional regulator [Paraburkholderia phosphatilytica]|uniref:TetR/AcrR family transcriptional regulator n=1 Tax=Paraburkholderia phosphatilytica TaxID=2282883 RepID=UPI000E522DCC|nr:TetR/AcrR family transcriptional regulator [Paraburkholderia phosphatilytica]